MLIEIILMISFENLSSSYFNKNPSIINPANTIKLCIELIRFSNSTTELSLLGLTNVAMPIKLFLLLFISKECFLPSLVFAAFLRIFILKSELIISEISLVRLISLK